MLHRFWLTVFAGSGLLLAGSGCATTDAGFSPSTQDFGGGANMRTQIVSPQSAQPFPAGRDIPIVASAWDVSGIKQVTLLVNNQPVAKDDTAPYTGVLAKPAPGQYVLQSYATSKYGDAKLSAPTYITVK